MEFYEMYYPFVMGFSFMAIVLAAWHTWRRTYRTNNTESSRKAGQIKEANGGYLLEGKIDEETGHKEEKMFEEVRRYPAQEDFKHFRSDLPQFSADEIKKHNRDGTRIWTTFRKGVYDITDYSKRHPGGDVILQAAGSSMDDIWEVLQQHNQPGVLLVLRHLRIGNFVGDKGDLGVTRIEAYKNEPKRDRNLQTLLPKPFNGTPYPRILIENYITPGKYLYVRNHVEVPRLDAAEHRLEISGIGLESGSKILTLEDLKTKFEQQTVLAAIQCSGNRRREMGKVRRVTGVRWDQGAIGNLYWQGVYLHEVLRWAGLKEDTPNAFHVHFFGQDVDTAGEPYCVSMPFAKVMDPTQEVLLAYGVNDEPLLPDHGYPLRMFAPGTLGARCCKWLFRIEIRSEETRHYAQRVDNKLYPPDADWETADFDRTPSLLEMAVNSAICQPDDKANISISQGVLAVKGYAWSGGGRGIARVDVSLDGGQKWQEAEKFVQKNPKSDKIWAWTFWNLDVPLNSYKAGDSIQVKCRATDTSSATQSEDLKKIWNMLGEGNNSHHQITVNFVE